MAGIPIYNGDQLVGYRYGPGSQGLARQMGNSDTISRSSPVLTLSGVPVGTAYGSFANPNGAPVVSSTAIDPKIESTPVRDSTGRIIGYAYGQFRDPIEAANMGNNGFGISGNYDLFGHNLGKYALGHTGWDDVTGIFSSCTIL